MEEQTLVLLLAAMLLLVSVFQAVQVGDLAAKIDGKIKLAAANAIAVPVQQYLSGSRAAAPAAQPSAQAGSGLGGYARQVGGC